MSRGDSLYAHALVRRALRLLAVGLLIASTALAQAATLDEVRGALAALRGGTLTPDGAASVAQAYLQAHPESPLAMVYLGSVRTLQSAAASVPWRRLSYMGEGLKLLDRSAAAASVAGATPSQSVEILLLAGITNASIPTVFKRRKAAIACLERLSALPGFTTLDNASQALAHAWLASLGAGERVGVSETHRATAYRLDARVADSVLKKS